MQTGKLKNGTAVFLHIVTWTLLVFVLFYPPFSWDKSPPASFWIKQVINLLIMVGVFYFNARFMAPRFLLKGNLAAFIAWFVLSLVLMLFIARVIELQLRVAEDTAALIPGYKPKSIYNLDMYLFIAFLMVLAVSTGVAAVERWHDEWKIRVEAEKQQISSELALLKAQINPHFFFNTLNNIYALTYSDAPMSRDAILKLSRMMRYVLYETLQDTAILSKEITFIKDYIELMKLRLHACTTVSFQEPKSDGDYAIAPMLLLPFVENAFKHGTSAMQDTRIFIDLKIENGVLSLHVINKIYHEKDPLKIDIGGIGLLNTQRRLNLLYPGKHMLNIDQNLESELYKVDLEINLASAVETTLPQIPKISDLISQSTSELKN